MPATPSIDVLHSHQGNLSAESTTPADDLAYLRHKVLNDYQAIVACIFDEGCRTTSAEVKDALLRVADRVQELASSLRQSESD